jgi:hypothetical protein
MFKFWIMDLMNNDEYLFPKNVEGLSRDTFIFKLKTGRIKTTKFQYVSWKGYLRDSSLEPTLKY